jgi:hypothetical protein
MIDMHEVVRRFAKVCDDFLVRIATKAAKNCRRVLLGDLF